MGDQGSGPYIRDAIRRRYLDLLVPALARIKSADRGSMIQLYRAVRRAADTCLVAAANHALSNYQSCWKWRRRLWLMRRSRRRRYRNRLLIMKKSITKTNLKQAYAKHQNAHHINIISVPSESELKRLQTVLLHPNISSGQQASTYIEPATLLTQAAHYILALQAQVGALTTLADHAAQTPCIPSP